VVEKLEQLILEGWGRGSLKAVGLTYIELSRVDKNVLRL
jgi:hypothetical protein